MPLLLPALAGCWVISADDVRRHDDGLETPAPTDSTATTDDTAGPPPGPDGDGTTLPTTTPLACTVVDFEDGPPMSAPPGATAAAAGDLDGDESMDLILAYPSTGAIGVAWGDGDGGLWPVDLVIPSGSSCPSAVGIGEMGPGRGAEALVVDDCAGKVRVFAYDSETRTLVQRWALDADGVGALVAVPLDADPVPDAVWVTGDGEVVPQLRRTDGYAPEEPVGLGGALASVAAGELTGDGVTDLAVVAPDDDAVFVLAGDGAGGFTEDRAEDVPGARAVFVADADGDGAPDLVVDRGGAIEVVGTAVGRTSTLLPDARLVGLAPFTQDGCASALAVEAGAAPELRWLPGRGDGSFGTSRTFRLPSVAAAVTVAQLDLPESPLDVVVVDGGAIRIWYGRAP